VIEKLKDWFTTFRIWLWPKYYVTYMFVNHEGFSRFNWFVIPSDVVCIHKFRAFILSAHKNPISNLAIIGVTEVSQTEYKALLLDKHKEHKAEDIRDHVNP
jgi:hypothetical protein